MNIIWKCVCLFSDACVRMCSCLSRYIVPLIYSVHNMQRNKTIWKQSKEDDCKQLNIKKCKFKKRKKEVEKL